MRRKLPASLFIIEELLRGGQGALARRELVRLARKRIARADLAAYAGLARRAGLAELAARLLHPLVRPQGRRPATASAAERAEFAGALVTLGVIAEGRELLDGLGAAAPVERDLFRAFACFAEWDYAGAIPHLERYARAPGLDGYQRLVARLNLAAALVVRREKRSAGKLIEEIVAETTARRYVRLLGNALELEAQQAFLAGRHAEALRCLDAAERTLKTFGYLDELFVRKWRAFVGLALAPRDRDARAAVARVRDQATEQGHWETARLCDAHEAIAERDEQRFLRVYFGTPFPAFRDQILGDFPGKLELPDDFLWPLGRGGPVVDWAALADWRGGDVRPGSTIHRFLVVLSTDLYKPWRVFPLHEKVFPGERFNPWSGPLRVRQTVRRARECLKALRLPVAIVQRDGGYRFEGSPGARLRLSIAPAAAGKTDGLLESLRREVGAREFRLGEAMAILALPRRSVSRALSTAVGERKLVTTGKGPATRFRFG